GKVISVELRGLELTLYMLPDAEGIQLMSHFDNTADTTLSGAPFALLRMANSKPGEGLFTGDVEIHGDVELGQHFQRILNGLDIDWEEHLSHLSGDIIAHQAGTLARNLKAWGTQAADNLSLDITEYLQQETHTLPTATEVEGFLTEIDELRMSADRLQARVHRLLQQVKIRTESTGERTS
ncbi:MAG: SCP2 sterol-binding domain-containing protein, partial [Gammaproteobacteria bacterium]|nr:SCP2 sterol-binding domain-containing protein [Gammaproteobacteria bacterium]